MVDAVRNSLSPPASESSLNPHLIPLLLINLEDCLAMSRVSETTFYRLVKAGVFPAPVKIGRSNRWTYASMVSAIERLAQGQA